MFEKAFFEFMSNSCKNFVEIYYLNAPKNKKTPYGVIYPASNTSDGAGGDAIRVNTIYRLEIYGIDKENSLLISYKVKNALNKYRGQIGMFKDVFIKCQYPSIVAFGDGTYKVILEIDTQYIDNGGYNGSKNNN